MIISVGSKDTFLEFLSHSFAIRQSNIPATLAGMSSGIYSFYDHLVCGYMRKGLADCCSSNRFFLICNFWCKEHLMNFVTDYIQASLFAAITLTFQFSLCQIHIPHRNFFPVDMTDAS